MKNRQIQTFSTLSTISAVTEDCPLTIYRRKGLDNALSENTNMYIKRTSATKIYGVFSL